MLMVYSYHLRKTSTQLNKYNNQIGGLALAAAAVSKPIYVLQIRSHADIYPG